MPIGKNIKCKIWARGMGSLRQDNWFSSNKVIFQTLGAWFEISHQKGEKNLSHLILPSFRAP